METKTDRAERNDGAQVRSESWLDSSSTNDHYGCPGPGGSLGKCALCGENFMAAILLGSDMKTFTVSGCDSTFYAHEKCAEKYSGQARLDVLQLPAKSPLRQAYEESNAAGEPLRASNRSVENTTKKTHEYEYRKYD